MSVNLVVICQSYPSDADLYAMGYVHARNKVYQELGHVVRVVSFSTRTCYKFDGVDVYPAGDFKKLGRADLYVSHAPNIRNHVPLINRADEAPVIFVIHGHEVLYRPRYYPRPYRKLRKWWEPLELGTYAAYDSFKLMFLSQWFAKGLHSGRFRLVFVSSWMRDEFLKNINISRSLVEQASSVINNPVSQHFVQGQYCLAGEPSADFVTIRPFDNPKYGVDLVVKWAKATPEATFHIYGKGAYFKRHAKPANLTVHEKFLAQKDMPGVLNKYRCALMPTRLDAQGVAMCEMAVLGIPLITSDLPICKEMLEGFTNVSFISNEHDGSIAPLTAELRPARSTPDRFGATFTAVKELEYFGEVLASSAGNGSSQRI